MTQNLPRIDPRRMPFVAGAAIVVVAALLVSYLLLPQYNALRAVSHEVRMLQQTLQAADAVTAEQARVQAEVARLEHELSAVSGGIPQHGLAALVIGQLQDISWRRDIELVDIQPSTGVQIGGVHENLFQIDLSGEYPDLLHWLRDIRIELALVTVREISLMPLDSENREPRLRAGLVLAAYGSAE